MAVNVEYIIKLNDQLSRRLDAIQKQVDKLNNKVTKTKSAFEGLGGIIAKIGITAIVASAAKSIVTLGVEMEQTRIAFATFLGSAEKGNEVLEKLNKFANVTPFDNAQVIAASKTLLAFGVTADELEPTLKILGDVSAGTGKDLSEMGRIFGKIKGNGRLMGEELNMLIDAGFNPLQQMSERTGESMIDLRKKMEKGQISFEMIREEFVRATGEGGRFANMMEKQSKTVGGRFSTLLGQLQTLGIRIGEAINPTLGVLVDLGNMLVTNNELLGDIALVVGIAVAAFGAFKIAAFAAMIQTQGLTAAQWLLNIALNANPIGLVIAAIAALVAIVVIAIRHFETWGAALLFIMGPFGQLINVIQAFRRNWEDIKNAFNDGGIIDGLLKIGAVLLDALLMPMQQLLEIMSNIPGLGGLAGSGAQKIENLRKSLGVRTATSGSASGSLTGAAGELGAGAGGGITAETGSGKLGGGVSEIKAGAPKTFNINIEKLVEALNINTTNLRDTAGRIEDEVKRALLTAVTDASIIAE